MMSLWCEGLFAAASGTHSTRWIRPLRQDIKTRDVGYMTIQETIDLVMDGDMGIRLAR